MESRPLHLVTYRFVVEIECASQEQAEEVLRERLGYDEDYGFPYTISDATPAKEESHELLGS